MRRIVNLAKVQNLRKVWPVGLILFLAWALRLYRLSTQSLWYDEGYAVYVTHLSPADVLLWSSRDFVPPLHSYLLALWLGLAGQTEFAARFPSAGMGVLAVATFVSLGKTLWRQAFEPAVGSLERLPRAGTVAGLLAALSPFYVWHSQDARIYMMLAALGALATLLLLRALRRPERWRLWAGLALLDALVLYTHATGGFLIAFHALVILACGLGRNARLLPRGGLALAAALALWLPWLIYALPFLGQNTGYWPGQLNWPFIAWGAARGFVTGQVMSGALATAALVVWSVACMAGLLALLIARRWKTALFLVAYFAVPVTAMAWLFRDVPKFSPRYLILASPPLFLLPAIGFAAVKRAAINRRRWIACPALALQASAVIALLVTAGLGLRNWYFDPAFAKSDFRAAARLVREEMQPGEIVLIVPGHTFPVWQYYFGEASWVALPDDPILDVSHTLYYLNTVARLNEALAGRSGAWLVEWEPWQIDPTGLVEQLLGQVGKEVPLPEQPAGMRLVHFRLLADQLPLPPEPAVTPPVHALFELPLSLDGCVLPESMHGDQPLRTACYWQAWGTLPEHLSVSARVVDAAGIEWGRADSAISGPYLVAGRWPQDEPVLGGYSVPLASGIPPGGFYLLQMLVYEPDGTSHGEAILAPVAIARPLRPFTATLSAGQTVSASLSGLTLEAADVRPQRVLPGEEVLVEAIWRVDGPFDEPRLAAEGQPDKYPLLPQPGATRLWQPGDRYRTVTVVPVSPYAPGGATSIWAVSADGRVPVGVVSVDVTRTFALPAGVPPLDYRLGDSISLAGAQVAVEPGDAGKTAQVVLYWQAGAIITQTYTVFVQLIGPDGAAHAQADSWPQSGRHPTNHWLPGEVVPDPYQLTLPADAPPGRYRIIAGMYDLATMERLPVTDAAGNPVPDNAIPLGEFAFP